MSDQERRLHIRHRTNTAVKISADTSKKLTTAVNLSASGVLIKTEGMSLRPGTVVELSFMINLGTVTKIHHRKARVAHITNGHTGFYMEAFKKN